MLLTSLLLHFAHLTTFFTLSCALIVILSMHTYSLSHFNVATIGFLLYFLSVLLSFFVAIVHLAFLLFIV